MKAHLNLEHRHWLAKTLPANGHSFAESVRIRNLRGRLALSDEHLKEAGFDSGTGAYDVSHTWEYDFDSADIVIIAGGLSLHRMECEEKGAVPADNAYLDLHLEIFADAIAVLEKGDNPDPAQKRKNGRKKEKAEAA